MSEFITIQISIIAELDKLIITNPNFDADHWSYFDAKILIKAGNMIRWELYKKQEKKEENKKQQYRPIDNIRKGIT